MITLIISSAVYYAGLRLTQTLNKESQWRLTIWALLIIWAALLLLVPILTRVLGLNDFESNYPDAVKIINLVAYGYMGFMAILVFSLFTFDLIKVIWITFFHADDINPTRRAFIFNYTPWGIFGLTSVLAGVGYKDAVNYPKMKKVSVPKKDLHPDLHGFKIIQISDLHVGSTIKKNYVEKVVEAVLEAKPDLIALTGDLVDGHVDALSPELEPLLKLKATHGVFYVTGNHEYYWGAESWVKKMQGMGFKTLQNQHQVLNHKGSQVLISGIPDVHAERFNPEHKADAVLSVKGAPVCDYGIFLAHQPSSYKLAEDITCDLQLSGHTHAGQFYPIGFIIGFFHKYYKGLNLHLGKKNGEFWVYVNSGTGYWGPPNRLGIPSEITLLELTKA